MSEHLQRDVRGDVGTVVVHRQRRVAIDVRIAHRHSQLCGHCLHLTPTAGGQAYSDRKPAADG
jgi:ribosomal protein L21E